MPDNYTTTLRHVAALIDRHDLPTPLSVSDETYPKPHLTIQVQGQHWRRWYEVLNPTHVRAETIGDRRHMHAFGWIGPLAGATRVRVMAVVPLTDLDTDASAPAEVDA